MAGAFSRDPIGGAARGGTPAGPGWRHALKTYIIGIAAAATLAISLPVASMAQETSTYASQERTDGVRMAWPLDRREDWLESRIQRAADHGSLSGNEEERGRNELHAIRVEQARLLERDGGALTEADSSYLAHRIDELNGTLRWTGENPPPPWSFR
jgi:hypothetical protein